MDEFATSQERQAADISRARIKKAQRASKARVQWRRLNPGETERSSTIATRSSGAKSAQATGPTPYNCHVNYSGEPNLNEGRPAKYFIDKNVNAAVVYGYTGGVVKNYRGDELVSEVYYVGSVIVSWPPGYGASAMNGFGEVLPNTTYVELQAGIQGWGFAGAWEPGLHLPSFAMGPAGSTGPFPAFGSLSVYETYPAAHSGGPVDE